MTIPAGRRLGPDEILLPVGSGGMGEVYRARDTRLNRDVALKVLPVSLLADANRLRRFEHEARAAGAVNHPNVLAVFDVGSTDGLPYLVCELLEGETLGSTLRVGPLPPRKAVDYAAQIARGLAAAHDKGIVHRDLKPENIFVTTSGHVKILDFGLAKLTDVDPEAQTITRQTAPGTVLGTVDYMSPEQARGETADARSDIFSFGVVLYEMLSGRHPFHRGSATETMAAILRDDPPTLSAGSPAISAGLDRVLRSCLEKRSGERFESAHDLALALEAVSESPGPAPAVRGRRGWWWAAAGLAAVIAVGASVAWPARSPPATDVIPSIAVLPLENLSREASQDYFADGMTEALITDLAKVGGLRVISRTSVMRYKGTSKGVPAIAGEVPALSSEEEERTIMQVIRLFILITAMLVATVSGSEQQEWSYEGATGPQNWGKLSPANVMCEAGRNQSPINIEGALQAAAKPLHPSYAAGSKDIVNNGHTVQVDFEPGDTLPVDNLTFSLNQVHFHAPSENLIAGQSFPMEAHFVHADAQGSLLVVAVMFKEGETNTALSPAWAALPPDAGPARPLPNTIKPLALLPKSMSYYRFSGSLTTPPCTEGVRWLVLKTPVSASRTQIDAFQRAIKHHNNRPVQPLNGRVIVEVK